jgi:hypothetical protein
MIGGTRFNGVFPGIAMCSDHGPDRVIRDKAGPAGLVASKVTRSANTPHRPSASSFGLVRRETVGVGATLSVVYSEIDGRSSYRRFGRQALMRMPPPR